MTFDKVYSLSGRISVPGLLGACAIAAGLVLIASPFYAAALFFMPFIYINCFITFGYGIFVGYATGYACKLGMIRHVGLASFLALLVSVFADFFGWVFWFLLTEHRLIIGPTEMIHALTALARIGSWSVGKLTPRGTHLELIWVAELTAIFLLAILFVRFYFEEEVFCERCQKWLPKPERIGPLKSLLQQNAPFSLSPAVLDALGPASDSDPVTTLLDLRRCSSCRELHLLTVLCEVKAEDSGGNVSTKTETIAANLEIDPHLFQSLQNKRYTMNQV